jgi:glycosyltransferase involved in cell wall biosynthesis
MRTKLPGTLLSTLARQSKNPCGPGMIDTQASVIVGLPQWAMGGVTAFASNLVRGLQDRGVAVHILVTDSQNHAGQALPQPPDLVVEDAPWKQERSRRRRWRALTRYLEDRAPCIYLPNHDFESACVSAGLSSRVAVVGHLHGDSEEYYEYFAALGRYWNATVCGSGHIASVVASRYPALASRVVVIPYGVTLPKQLPAKETRAGMPLRILYAGRLKHATKGVLYLPPIMDALLRRQVPARLDITGTGPDEEALKAAFKPLVEQGIVRFLGIVPEEKLPEVYAQNDVYLLTSMFEGKPVSLVEAMGYGCVPVVSDIPSGIPELVHDGKNGYTIPVGATEVYADRLTLLYHELGRRRQMAEQAYATVVSGGYRIEDMTAGYLELFGKVWQEAKRGVYRRPKGKMIPPSFLRQSWKDRLPRPLRALGVGCKRLLRRMHSAS